MALRNSKGRFTRKAPKASRKSGGRKRNSRGRFLRRGATRKNNRRN